MSRTFSLARLLLGITAFCLLCGLAVNFPEAARACAFIISLLAPTVVVALVLGGFARSRGPFNGTVAFGGMIGAFAMALFMGGPPGPWWLDYLVFVAHSGGGALILGIAALLDERIAAHRDRS